MCSLPWFPEQEPSCLGHPPVCSRKGWRLLSQSGLSLLELIRLMFILYHHFQAPI